MIPLLFAFALAGSTAPARQPGNSAMQSRSYTADDSDFANPERGFWLADRHLDRGRAANMSLAHAYVRLDAYRDSPLPDSVLRELQQRFDAARSAGIKLVPRFTYNFPKGLPLAPGDEDAPLPIVLGHIAQLQPILRRNSDVIAYLEAGFVGAWGEWHDSTSGLTRTDAEKAILDRLLRAMPKDRFVALRYERDKAAIFGRSTPASVTDMLGHTDYGRVAHHDDCFLASPDGWDTYRPADPASLARQKAYLAAENEHSPQGGETCTADSVARPLIQCPNALRELQALHWSQINTEYHPAVIKLWRAQGCYGEISRRLGYRLRLVRSRFPLRARAGGTLSGWVTMANDGFAAPYNRRPVELVLRRSGTQQTTVLPLKLDPRLWTSGAKHPIRIAAVLPKSLAPGRYELLLNLPDAATRLRGRADYSIRLANTNTWEPRTGYNRLLASVDVTLSPPLSSPGR